MWELKTINPITHILRVGEDPSSFNKWLPLVTIFSSILEAVLLPVLISLLWITIYRLKRKMNGSEFRLCMQATHGSTYKFLADLFIRLKISSKRVIILVILIFMMNILGKSIPNVMVAQVIGIHNFTKIVHNNNGDLFKNDLNCEYMACSSDLENNFALVLNSTSLENNLRAYNVKNAYWNLSNNNILDAIRVDFNTTSCEFIMGIGGDSLSSDSLGNATDTPPAPGRFTGSYGGFSTRPTRDVSIHAAEIQVSIDTTIMDRCDIPLNMFYISPNFNPNVMKMAKWLKDSGRYPEDRPFNRSCQVIMSCDANVEWKKMQIVGNTPDNMELLEVNFNNSILKLNELFSTNVKDYNFNGEAFGERLIDSTVVKFQTIITNWREIIKFQGSKYNYNFLDDYSNTLSQSLVSSIQSMTNNINVNVDRIENIQAPGIWIEIFILSFVIFFICSLLSLTLTTKNLSLLLPLSLLDFGFISNSIFKEDSKKKLPGHLNWFMMNYLRQMRLTDIIVDFMK
ncbi:hypothetical protein RclHR1_03200004 [Rhizophagus clarus]|uniref:Uncharacterized protein n=1 Tax=Rhizophagus clarus TaxID=94130 RepID=A0A2Z6RJT3_9GLOM|nr:hypothetical protein RclHR1_03200004 [Rhizophagus clarus]GES97315.1 hypothetical protein GLOIN_2v1732713 [Rhizophagus clarus]